MCPPLLAVLGTGAAATGVGTSAAVAATSGLFGAGGAFSLGTTLTTLAAIGGGVSSLMAAQQARANLQYQSSMANYNATVAENNALAAKPTTKLKYSRIGFAAYRRPRAQNMLPPGC